MRENYYKKEYERLRQENAELKMQLSEIENSLIEIADIRQIYSNAIKRFLDAEKKYNELILEVNKILGAQRGEMLALLKEMRNSK